MQAKTNSMENVIIKTTQNPVILKFEVKNLSIKGKGYEFRNIDEATTSPLARQLFYLPFVKTVYISQNFIAIERYNIVEWDDVQDAVAEQIDEFVAKGGTVIVEEEPKPWEKKATTIYGETTPNPAVLKFVANSRLTSVACEFHNIDHAKASPLAQELFKMPSVKEVFIDENYVSVTKYEAYDWNDITVEIRSFIRDFIQNGGIVVDESLLAQSEKTQKQKIEHFDTLDTTSQQIINILEEYVKPAVQADGGNILFDSYDPADKRVKVVLQGACSGCPSSTFTLKSGIENMLKDMLKDERIRVEAVNA